MKERFVACRRQELGLECDAQGWLIRQRIGTSGRFEKHVEGRCECWREWRRRIG